MIPIMWTTPGGYNKVYRGIGRKQKPTVVAIRRRGKVYLELDLFAITRRAYIPVGAVGEMYAAVRPYLRMKRGGFVDLLLCGEYLCADSVRAEDAEVAARAFAEVIERHLVWGSASDDKTEMPDWMRGRTGCVSPGPLATERAS